MLMLGDGTTAHPTPSNYPMIIVITVFGTLLAMTAVFFFHRYLIKRRSMQRDHADQGNRLAKPGLSARCREWVLKVGRNSEKKKKEEEERRREAAEEMAG